MTLRGGVNGYNSTDLMLEEFLYFSCGGIIPVTFVLESVIIEGDSEGMDPLTSSLLSSRLVERK